MGREQEIQRRGIDSWYTPGMRWLRAGRMTERSGCRRYRDIRDKVGGRMLAMLSISNFGQEGGSGSMLPS